MTQTRRLGHRISSLEKSRSSRGSQLAHSSLEDGALREFDLEGTQVAQYGKQFDGTSTAATLVSPEPPQPTTPAVVGVAGGLVATWDGLFADSPTTVAPMDWARTDVVVGPVGMDPIATPPSVSVTSPRGGEVFLPLPPGEYDVALVARTLAGRPSAPSAVRTATALPLVDDAQFQEALEDIAAADGRLTTAEGLVAANADEIEAAKTRLSKAEQDAIDALADALAANTLASGKITAFRQASAPSTTGRTAGDLWVDTDDGLLYVWTGSWTPSPDQRIATVVTSNATKTTLFSQISAPPTTGRTVGDMWIDTDDGNKIYVWPTGGGWTARVLGDSALASLDLNKLVVVGTADLNLAVAQHIAAKTAAFQQVDAANITVTGTSTLNDVVAQRLSAKIAEFIEITAQNIMVGALDGQVITGAVIQTAETGARLGLNTSAEANELTAYTGRSDETIPASLTAETGAGGIALRSATLGADAQPASIDIRASSGPGEPSEYSIDVQAERVALLSYVETYLSSQNETTGDVAMVSVLGENDSTAPSGASQQSGLTQPRSVWVNSRVGTGVAIDSDSYVYNRAGNTELILTPTKATIRTYEAPLQIDTAGIVADSMAPVFVQGAGAHVATAVAINADWPGASGHNVVFTVPPSGRVKVTFGAFVKSGVAGTAATLQFRLVDATSGAQVRAANVNEGLGNYNAQYINCSKTVLVTGLTAGQQIRAIAHIYTPANNAGAAWSNGQILVEPCL